MASQQNALIFKCRACGLVEGYFGFPLVLYQQKSVKKKKKKKTPVLAHRLLNILVWSTEEAGQGSKEMPYQLLQP